MARFRMKYKGKLNIGKIVAKIGGTILALWVGGIVLREVGIAALSACSPFFRGLELIGWEVGSNTTISALADSNSTQFYLNGFLVNDSAVWNLDCDDFFSENILYETTDSGILTVVGLIGIASIIMEFVTFRFS